MKKALLVISATIVVLGVSGCQTAAVQDSDSAGNSSKEAPQSIIETSSPAAGTANAADQAKSPSPAASNSSASYQKISRYLEEESKKAFSPYYELLDSTVSDYQEATVDGNVEATFGYTLVHKNFDKDPDTVDYIQKAKETGDPHYQQLHDEYLAPKEMSFHLKAVIDKTDSITLYSNASPKGVQWEKVTMADFVLKK